MNYVGMIIISLLLMNADAPSTLTHGKLNPKDSVYFTSDGIPFQCGPMSYYGAICWQPDGIPNSPKPIKGFMWTLVPENLPLTSK